MGNEEPRIVFDTRSRAVNYKFLRSNAIGLGAIVYALNGWYDHVHLVASVPAKLAVATFIGQVKAVATTKFNKSGHPLAPIFWQAEYAVFSLDKKRLPYHVAYVERQKEHHGDGQVIPTLEMSEAEKHSVRDEANKYEAISENDWITE
jgi:putative transposase